jgi:hypothetical protein
MVSGYLLLEVVAGPDVLTLSYRSQSTAGKAVCRPYTACAADHHLCPRRSKAWAVANPMPGPHRC